MIFECFLVVYLDIEDEFDKICTYNPTYTYIDYFTTNMICQDLVLYGGIKYTFILHRKKRKPIYLTISTSVPKIAIDLKVSIDVVKVANFLSKFQGRVDLNGCSHC